MSPNSLMKSAAALAIGASLLLGAAGSAFADRLPTFDAAQVTQIAASRLVLNTAIKVAEQSVKGRAYEAMAVENNGALSYVVEVMSNKKMWTISVDAKSGKVLSSTDNGLASDSKPGAVNYSGIDNVKFSIRYAINAAEQSVKGHALAAMFDDATGKPPVFRIEVAAKDKSIKTLTVDGKTGKIIDQAASLQVKPAMGSTRANLGDLG